MKNTIAFMLDGKVVELRFDASLMLTPTTTVLNYLRGLPGHRGTKEGCAEGDCGACTVVLGEATAGGRITYRAVDSCLLFLPMIHGKQLITVENLKDPEGRPHAVQQALIDAHGSQCGFCTPGVVMSLFALWKTADRPSWDEAAAALAGNLCRCTGYRPILQAAVEACRSGRLDQFAKEEQRTRDTLASISRESISLDIRGQRYDQPVSLDECLTLLERYPSAIVVNGATDVALRVTKKFEVLPHVLDCSRVAALQSTGRNDGGLTIGAGVRLADLLPVVASEYPALHQMLTVFGAQQIRSTATIGGNLGTASPVGDLLPVLTAYGAKIVLQSKRGLRRIAADAFVKGYRSTERRPDELIVAVELPPSSSGTTVRAYKISRRRDLDIASVSAGFALDRDREGKVGKIILAYGGMADRTRRAVSTEEFLRGRLWKRQTVEEAQEFVDRDFSPISDVRGSAEFRRIAARNLLLKFWTETRS